MQQTPLRLNLTEIIKSRLGNRSRWLPAFLLRPLERLICQDRLNALLQAAFPEEGNRFSLKILEELSITIDVKGLDKLPDGENYEFVSNHPLGGLDGIALVGVLGRKYGDDNLRVLVNDMLMNVKPLSNVFLPINKYGSQGRESANAINAAFRAGKHIVIFPAGLVSRLHPDGEIRDLSWQKFCVVKALEYKRKIVPVYFEGLNRRRFYRLADYRKRIGIKVNIEQALLPSELCHAAGSHYTINFGTPIDPVRLLEECGNPAAAAARLREIVYTLK